MLLKVFQVALKVAGVRPITAVATSILNKLVERGILDDSVLTPR
jgi:hypothetical protein